MGVDSQLQGYATKWKMILENYRDYDALGLAALVRSGEISALELLETAVGLAGRATGSSMR
jgi:hypothetical protein